MSRLALEATQSPVELLPGAVPFRAKWQVYGAVQSPLPSAEVKNK